MLWKWKEDSSTADILAFMCVYFQKQFLLVVSDEQNLPEHAQWECCRKRQMLSLFHIIIVLCGSWAYEEQNVKHIWKKRKSSNIFGLNRIKIFTLKSVLVRVLITACVPGQSGLFVHQSEDFQSKKRFLYLNSGEIRILKQMSNNKGNLVWHNTPVCFGSLSAFNLSAYWSSFVAIITTIITHYWNKTYITDFPLPNLALQIYINQCR